MTTHKCCYVLTPASEGVAAVYCGKPVGFTIERDDDRNKYRKYRSFCDKHQKIVDQQEEYND